MRYSFTALLLAGCVLQGCGSVPVNEMVDRLDCDRPVAQELPPPAAGKLAEYRLLSHARLVDLLLSDDPVAVRLAGRVLGDRFAFGQGVRPDPRAARHYYDFAAFLRTPPRHIINPGYAGTTPWVIRMEGPVTPADPTMMARLAAMYEQEGGAENTRRAESLRACITRIAGAGA